jgi:hypothetical protein
MTNLRSLIFGELNAAMHPRETFGAKGDLDSGGAELFADADGCSTVSLDLRGTFNLTVVVEGSNNGTTWHPIPMRPLNQNSVLRVIGIAGTTPGLWVGKCAQYRKVKARVTAFAALANATLCCDNGVLDDALLEGTTTSLVTATAAAGTALTLTLPSPGAGLRIAPTYLSFNRFATANLVAAAVPVLLTSTNFPGNLVLTLSAEALFLGQMNHWREDFAYAIAAVSQNTAVTFVMPAIPSVIPRLTAGYKIVT